MYTDHEQTCMKGRACLDTKRRGFPKNCAVITGIFWDCSRQDWVAIPGIGNNTVEEGDQGSGS